LHTFDYTMDSVLGFFGLSAPPAAEPVDIVAALKASTEMVKNLTRINAKISWQQRKVNKCVACNMHPVVRGSRPAATLLHAYAQCHARSRHRDRC
jgi:hypothetical protein